MHVKIKSGSLPLLAGALVLLAGCSKGGRVDDFTPSSDKAKQALEAGLKHLQEGNPTGTVPGTSPKIEMVDTKWKTGQLKAFEILGEEGPPAGSNVPRMFKVRLTPKTGPQEEARYVIVGIDPLWVYREEDFNAMSGMSK